MIGNAKEAPAPGCGKEEADPNGLNQKMPGAKLDAGKNRLGLVLFGFARALRAVGQVGTYGANKYSDNGWMKVTNGEARYTDAMLRHLLAEAEGEVIDPETKLMHAAQSAWNSLARLDLMLRRLGVNDVVPRFNDATECSGHKYPEACAQPGPDRRI